MAISTWVAIVIQICVLTAFSLVPRHDLLRRCCLSNEKNKSTCQRWRYKTAMVSVGSAKLLVKSGFAI